MKRISKSTDRSGLTFGDLVLAGSSFSHNSNETAAAVTDLLESGRVQQRSNHPSPRGVNFSSNRERYLPMKKPLKVAHRNYTLGDLIVAVSNQSRNSRETVAAIAGLLDSGRVRFQAGRRAVRARVF